MPRTLVALAISLVSLPLLADADLNLTLKPPAKVRAGLSGSLDLTIVNHGPDTATNVVLTVTTTGATNPCSGGCTEPYISPGGSWNSYIPFTAPLSGSVTATVTVTSATPDPNPSDNSATATIAVSTEPDLDTSIGSFFSTPLKQSQPFTLTASVSNVANFTAHNVVLTVDLPPGTGVTSLPANCTNASGDVVCTLGDIVQHYVQVKLDLTAPPDLQGGTLTFTATAHGDESDFLESNNTMSRTASEYRTTLVTTTADSGPGSLRQAILDTNASCVTIAPCLIGFQIDSPAPWKTIAVASPLPPITATYLFLDGTWQTEHVGDTNPDGPEIEISGGGVVPGDGLTFGTGRYCRSEVAGVAVGGFVGNGVMLTDGPRDCSAFELLSGSRWNVHDIFAGTDPTGSRANPNGLRGITVNATRFDSYANIVSNVLSGNTRSGVFDAAGPATIDNNRVGVKAHSDEPLPNGASGIYIAAQYTTAGNNVVAFNRDFGISVDKAPTLVALRGNRIWANDNLAIDVGLDGVMTPAPIENGTLGAPELTRAQYDPVTDTTTVEGDVHIAGGGMSTWGEVEIYASDTPGTRNMGDAQRLIGNVKAGVPLQTKTPPTHFTATIAGDHSGEWITATVTRVRYESFAKPQIIGGEYNPRTSELSFPLQVTR